MSVLLATLLLVQALSLVVLVIACLMLVELRDLLTDDD